MRKKSIKKVFVFLPFSDIIFRMEETELIRPAKKVDAVPLSEADKYNFLPYIDREADILPSEKNSWKTDDMAKAFMAALERGEDVSKTDWTGINLKGADLSGKDLSGLKLSKANLTGTKLVNANLKNADLSYAYMEGTDFSGADLSGVQFKGVFFKNCSIDNAEIDKESLAYLHSLEWFIEQLETGKIDIRSIPQDQLNYLDLRTIDLTNVDTSEVDLSAIALDGVNLSGVRVDKRHLQNMALFEKQKRQQQRIVDMNEKTQEILMQKIALERAEKIKQFAKEEFSRKQTTYTADVSKRPAKKELPPSKKFSESQDTHKSEGRVHETQTVVTSVRLVDRQKKRVRVQKTHLKKRA